MVQPELAGPSSSAPMASEAAPRFSMAGLRNSLKKYGRTGIIVYLGISCCVTTGFYIAIENHFDVKKFLNLQDKPENQEPSWWERVVTGKGSSIALALLCSKAMVPLKLPVAVAVTPYVHRTVQNIWRTASTKAA